MVGIVTVDDVIDKMVEDATDEFQRFGGNEVLSTYPICRSASWK